MESTNKQDYVIVGWTGFVGQTLFAQMQADGIPEITCYNSKTLQDLRGASVGTLILSCMPATKWWVNLHAEEDAETLRSILDILRTITADYVILISTVDVLLPTKQTELGQDFTDHPYGIHRRQFEQFVQHRWPSSQIIRLPALFGRGLKKNALYDLLHSNNVEGICLDSTFQWYNMGNLWKNIKAWRKEGIRMIQPVSEPISMRDITTAWFPTAVCNGSHPVSYDLQTIWKDTGYWTSKKQILEDIGVWIQKERRVRRLAASNIGYTMSEDVVRTFRFWGLTHLELALSRGLQLGGFAPWSVQSLLYGIPINIFARPNQFLQHMRAMMRRGAELGIQRYVFGCPQNRTLTTHVEDAIDLFRKFGDLAAEHGCVICVEPNAKAYGCTWLNTLGEVYEFVQAVQHPNIRINLDTGNFRMEDDPFVLETLPIEWVGHVQVSTPHLGHRLSEEDKALVRRFVAYLDKAGYEGCISFEAREIPFQEYRKGLQDFVETIRSLDG